jgi:hypothetical protein
MEEKRVEFLHHSLCVYVNILQTVTDQEREVIHSQSSSKGVTKMLIELPVYSHTSVFGKDWTSVM